MMVHNVLKWKTVQCEEGYIKVMNRNSVVPMYQQIADDLKSKIMSGEIAENTKLMSEDELEQNYGASRITVRRAISILADEELVAKKQGIGTFVTVKKLNRILSNKPLSFTEMCAAEGKTAAARIITVEQIAATKYLAKNLTCVNKGDKLIRLYRLRLCDGEPVMLEDTFLPEQYSLLLNSDLTSSISAALRKNGVALAHATKTVEICYAEPDEAKYLGVPEKQPLLLHKDFIYDQNGEQILFSKLVINPERYKLTIKI